MRQSRQDFWMKISTKEFREHRHWQVYLKLSLVIIVMAAAAAVGG
jgi:hypothetical protein